MGMIDYKPVDTGVIEVAKDGQTAKGLWMIRGSYSKIDVYKRQGRRIQLYIVK